MKLKNLRKYIPITTSVDIVDSETKLIMVLMSNVWSEIKLYADCEVEQIYPRNRYTLAIEIKRPKN